MFEKKLMMLQNAIENKLRLEESVGKKELLSGDLVMILRNMRDLYGLNKLLFNMLLEFRDNVNKMTSETEVRNQLIAIKNLYDLKFEMLEERLKRINAKDEEEIRNNKNN
ncbi:MAG TPA: hypothetical protein VH415_17470 [Nitrososphaeraceae archaeon]